MADRILVCDKLAAEGLRLLEGAGEVVVADHTWTEDELADGLGDFAAVIVRSQTKLTARAIRAASNLKIIARAGVGVDNVDVAAATERGVVVVNSPTGNTVAAAEHAVAMLLAAARKIPQANQSLRNKEWNRGAFLGGEVNGKVLGVVGLGKIGVEVVRRAKALGMQALAYDPYRVPEHASHLGVEMVSLDELLERSDFVSLHAAATPETQGMIGAAQLGAMKPTAILVNCARGELVDQEALLAALESEAIGGAALDVFAPEPPEDFRLVQHPNVIATPHLGASTREAQVNVAVDVAEQVVDVLAGRPARTPVNLPSLSPELLEEIGAYLPLAERMGRLAGQIVAGPIKSVEITYAGELAEKTAVPLRLHFIVGLLSRSVESVNLVNAPVLAAERGIDVVETKSFSAQDYVSLLGASVEREGEPALRIMGTVFGRQDARIVSVDDCRMDIVPEGLVLFSWHHDQPGIIGRVGTLLGDGQINIAGMQVGRDAVGGEAIMALSVDQPIPPDLQREIEQHPAIIRTRLVDFEANG